MIPKLEDYSDIIDDSIIGKIREEAAPLSEKHVEHVNSTFEGGGVAEILNTLALLMNDVGIRTGWRLFKGHQRFFNITKSFHNGLQGGTLELTDEIKNEYLQNNEFNSLLMHISFCDCIVIHDPQPLPLISFYKKKQPWIWRCHIDLTNPHKELWEYVKQFILKYDTMVVSMDKYIKKDINIPQKIIQPSIDPLSTKNKPISKEEAFKNLEKYGVENKKPIVSQISRFDPWKDPLGVIDAYKLIKKQHDCQLVLMANMASDDPEGPKIYEQVLEKVKDVEDIHLIVNAEENDIMVNSLQRASTVVIQKSIREGFGLTVAEALWKGTPVVGGNVGGIPSQVIDGKTGYLINNTQECADRVLKILKNEKLREELGKNAKEHVRKNFLITRHLMDYIRLLKSVIL